MSKKSSTFAAQKFLDMKKYVIICLMAVVGWMLTSCETNEPCRFHKVNVDFRVPESAWSYDADNGWFSYYYPTNILTTSVYDYGTWTMSHEYNPGTKDAYLIQLPELYFLSGTATDGSTVYYTQRVDYEVGVGYVRVYVTNSDFIYDYGWKPEEMCFHMQIVY